MIKATSLRAANPIGLPRLVSLAFVFFVSFCGVFLSARDAAAYPWMIRHEYTGCATCHVDPSGSGLLTPYGRAQSDLLLSTQWKHRAEDEEPSTFSDFLFGAFKEPDWLTLGGWVRNAYIFNTVDTPGGTVHDNRFLQMRADLGAGLKVDWFRAAASLGWNRQESASYSQLAWVTHDASWGSIVSREHWVGASLDDDAVLLRAGRLNLPFGLRNVEHTSFVRSGTRTDVNQAQQDGVAAALTLDKIRGEAMVILGNYQLNPDAYRERGYSAFAEYSIAPRYGVGVSSLITHADADVASRVATWRQAHGVFGRAAPVKPLVILAEVDMLVTSPKGVDAQLGYTGLVQLDYEPLQGVHVMGSGEMLRRGLQGESTQLGGWLGAAWYPLSHFEVRFDAIRRGASGTPATMTYLAQAQVYL